MEEIEVKREEENTKAHESVMDYDQGFTPRYEKKVKVVKETEPEPEVPEQEDDDAAKSGSVQENTETKETKDTNEVEKAKVSNFAITVDTDIWNQIARLLHAIRANAQLSLDRNGMHVRMTDAAHVAMVTIDVPRENLRELDLPDNDTKFAVDLETFPKMKNGSTMGIRRHNSGYDLEVSCNGLEYTVPEIEATTPVEKLPELNYEDYAVVGVDALRKFIGAAKSLTDAFRITFDPYNVELKSQNDTNAIRAVLTKEYGLTDSRIREKCRSSYPTEYVEKLLKAVTTVTEMKLEIKDDYPLKATFWLPETVAKAKGYYAHGVIPCTYLLAPRMEQ
ncbi:MAG: hypothetical protein QXU18_00290 [Thermoplasmatales archaeon]